MLVQLSSMEALLIPDEFVTGDVIQALLNSTNAKAEYESGFGYRWTPAGAVITITPQNALTPKKEPTSEEIF